MTNSQDSANKVPRSCGVMSRPQLASDVPQGAPFTSISWLRAPWAYCGGMGLDLDMVPDLDTLVGFALGRRF